MPILSIIPADQVLTVAIKDAIKNTSTTHPARITTTIQKMRPDWSVNKRRVKRLLRSINNDTWKAGLGVKTSSVSSGSTSTPEAAGADDASSDATSPPPSCPASGNARTTKGRERAATSGGRKVQTPTRSSPTKNSRSDADGDTGSDGSQTCTTAPASPGSPASCTMVPLGIVPVLANVGVSMSPTVVVTTTVLNSDSRDAHPKEPSIDRAEIHPPLLVEHSTLPLPPANSIPWDKAADATDTTVDEDVAVGDSSAVVTPAGEDLSESLKLEPDIELEPGVDLSVDLGLGDVSLGTDVAVGGSGADTAVAGGGEEGSSGYTLRNGAGIDAPFGDGVSAGAVGHRPDDMGFEMISKDEVDEVALEAEDPCDSAHRPSRASRRGWTWSWSRN